MGVVKKEISVLMAVRILLQESILRIGLLSCLKENNHRSYLNAPKILDIIFHSFIPSIKLFDQSLLLVRYFHFLTLPNNIELDKHIKKLSVYSTIID